MNWKEHLEWINSKTTEELEDEKDEINKNIRDSAVDSMNKIHWILKLDKTKKEKLDEIAKIESEYNKKCEHSIGPWILKNRKERYSEDPEAYKIEWHGLQEFSEKLKKEFNEDTD
jgi:hypothetical protein